LGVAQPRNRRDNQGVIRLLALLLTLLTAPPPFTSSVRPLPAPVKAELKQGGFWRKGCPVPLSGLRLLTVSHRGFDGRVHNGQLVVNRDATAPLATVFHKLYRSHFPIRHMRLVDVYGPRRSQPVDGDVSGSFYCRPAAPSPCSGGKGTSWSRTRMSAVGRRTTARA
jgi:hypothetical protein